MRKRFSGIVLALLIGAGLATTAASAQSYPDKPVKIITHSAPGGAPDVQLRIIAEKLSQIWGQQVIVMNHPGAGGSIAARTAAAAAADGYTLYAPAASAFVTLPGLHPNLPLQVPRDFIPIAHVGEQPMFITVTPSLGVSTLPELIALAKKKPGQISFAATGRGTLTHLTGEALQLKADIKLQLVPYTGGAANALSDVMSGRVSMVIDGYAALAGAIKDGRIKALAVGSPKRLPDFPNIPTIAETLPGFNSRGWLVLVAQRGTPDAVVQKVSKGVRAAISDPTVVKKLNTLGNYMLDLTPAEVEAYIGEEQKMWRPVVEKVMANK